MMHEHDQELIMALAEGTLDDAAAAEAAAEIAACTECSADLELQRLALAALDELPDVYLTATESADLHAGLKRELGVATPAPSRARSSFAWSRWLPAVGVAAVLLVAVVSLPSLLQGSDDAADMTVAATETTEAALSIEEAADAPAAALPRDGSEEMMAGGATQADAVAEDDAAPETTAAAAAEATTEAPETTAADLANLMDVLEYLGSIDTLDTAELADTLIQDEAGVYLRMSNDAKSLDPLFAECLADTAVASAELGIPVSSEPVILGFVENVEGEEAVVVGYVPASVEDTVFAIHHPDSCELIAVLP